MKHCPICTTPTEHQRESTPYWICPTCDLWFQNPQPPKLLHGPHEAPPDAMGDVEKKINADLAQRLFDKVMGGKPGMTLDVGSAYPYLAHSLSGLGCLAWAMEPAPEAAKWAVQLCVGPITADFDQFDPGPPYSAPVYDLITFIHSWEHSYDQLAAIRKARRLLAHDGALFIRMPDHRVPGAERDLTPGHYLIHPTFNTLTSMLQLLAETNTFAMTEQWPLMPGQRDIVLRPLT